MIGAVSVQRICGPNAKAIIQPTRGITLFGTLERVGGHTSPDITIANNLTDTNGLEVRIPSGGGGARGTAVFNWREWSGSGWTAWSSNILTAATVAGIGSRGYSLGFAVGTFVALDAYQSVVGDIAGLLGTTWTGETATAAVRPALTRVNGQPALLFDGVAKRLSPATTTVAPALISGEDTAFELQFVFQYLGTLTPTGAASIIALCDGSAGDQGNFYFYVWTDGSWGISKRGSTGGTVQVTGGTADNLVHRARIRHTGTGVSLWIDDVAVTLSSSGAQNTAAISATFPRYLMLGSASTPGVPPADNTYGHVALGAMLAWSGNPSAEITTPAARYLKNLYRL